VAPALALLLLSAACDDQTGSRVKVRGSTGATSPVDLATGVGGGGGSGGGSSARPASPNPSPGGGGGSPALKPPAFKMPVVTDLQLIEAKDSSSSYAPLLTEVIASVSYHPRWPNATVAYKAGAKPLTAAQQAILGENVDLVNKATGFKVFTYVGAASSADIVIEDASLSPGVGGVWYWKLIAPTGTSSFHLAGRMDLLRGMSDHGVRVVALHELGHAIGLDHLPSRDSIMCTECDQEHGNVPGDFTKQEKATLNLLYSLPDPR